MQTDAEHFALDAIGQIAIPVVDIDRAIGFYRDVLGLPFLFQAPPALAFFDCLGIRLMLEEAGSSQSERGSSIIYFRVNDMQRAAAALRSRGVRFESEPHLVARLSDHELWMAFFRDSEGNMLAAMSEVRA